MTYHQMEQILQDKIAMLEQHMKMTGISDAWEQDAILLASVRTELSELSNSHLVLHGLVSLN